MHASRVAAVGFIAAVSLVLAACAASSSPAPSVTPDAESVGDVDNVSACEYLAENAIPDALDFFETYTAARDSADEGDLDGIINRLDVARTSASGDLADSIDSTLVEFEAIQTRYRTGSETEPEVNYQAMADSLGAMMDTCIELGVD